MATAYKRLCKAYYYKMRDGKPGKNRVKLSDSLNFVSESNFVIMVQN